MVNISSRYAPLVMSSGEHLPCSWAQELVDPVVDFDQHKRWDDERLGSPVDQVDASSVVGIARVEERENRPGVENQRQSAERGSAHGRRFVACRRGRCASTACGDADARASITTKLPHFAFDHFS